MRDVIKQNKKAVSSTAWPSRLPRATAQLIFVYQSSISQSSPTRKQRRLSPGPKQLAFRKTCSTLRGIAGDKRTRSTTLDKENSSDHVGCHSKPSSPSFTCNQQPLCKQQDFAKFPDHDNSPPESDTAELWETVRAKIAQLQWSPSTTYETMSTTTNIPITTDIIKNYGQLLPDCAKGPESIAEDLKVPRTTGDPQWTNVSIDDIVKLTQYNSRAYSCSLLDLTDFVMLILLPRREEWWNHLDYTDREHQNTNGHRQPDSNGPSTQPSIKDLRFSYKHHSAGSWCFGLSLYRSFAKEHTLILSTIPSLLSEYGFSAPFLHVLCSPGEAHNLHDEWQQHAYKELWIQLRMKRRPDCCDETKTQMASSLRQFVYLFANSEVEVWKMSIVTHDDQANKALIRLEPQPHVLPAQLAPLGLLSRGVQSHPSIEPLSTTSTSRSNSRRNPTPLGPDVSDAQQPETPAGPTFAKYLAGGHNHNQSMVLHRTKNASTGPSSRLSNTFHDSSPTFHFHYNRRRLAKLKLTTFSEASQFSEWNKAIMKLGQVKHSMAFVEFIYGKFAGSRGE